MCSPISATATAPTPSSPGSAASCSSSPDPAARARRVGRDGALRLAFERRHGRTVLAERRFTLPLGALDAMDLDGSGAATLMLVNPTGGLVGGDTLETSVVLGAGTRVCLTSVGATRVYRSAGPAAAQRMVAVLEGDAALEYLPDHVIPSPGARLRQHTEVRLGADATFIGAESWAVGRVARGERWGFAELDTSLLVSDGRGLLLKDRAILDGSRRWDGLGGTEGCAYVAAFVAVSPGRGGWDALARDLQGALEPSLIRGPCAAAPLARGGILVRLLCPSAPTLGIAVERLWGICRSRLLGLGPLSLRKL